MPDSSIYIAEEWKTFKKYTGHDLICFFSSNLVIDDEEPFWYESNFEKVKILMGYIVFFIQN